MGDDGQFFVYDKKTGRKFKTTPDASFFENNLNTVELPSGEKIDVIEKLYAATEAEAWDALDAIRSTPVSGSVELRHRMDLYFFLLFLFWRVPGNHSDAETISSEAFTGSPVFDYVKLSKDDGTELPADALAEFKKSQAWQKSTKLLLPFAPFFQKDEWSKDLVNWRFVHSGDDQNWFVVGDNPIVTTGEKDTDPLSCLSDFVFPVSGKILLLSRAERQAQSFPPEFTVQFGVSVFERSSRFVACHREDFLDALVNLHGVYQRIGRTHMIIPELFEMIPDVYT